MILSKALYFQLPVWYTSGLCFSSLFSFFLDLLLLREKDNEKRCLGVIFVATEAGIVGVQSCFAAGRDIDTRIF